MLRMDPTLLLKSTPASAQIITLLRVGIIVQLYISTLAKNYETISANKFSPRDSAYHKECGKTGFTRNQNQLSIPSPYIEGPTMTTTLTQATQQQWLWVSLSLGDQDQSTNPQLLYIKVINYSINTISKIQK